MSLNQDEPVVMGYEYALAGRANEILDLKIELWREKWERASKNIEYYKLQRALPPELRYAHYPAHEQKAKDYLAKLEKENK